MSDIWRVVFTANVLHFRTSKVAKRKKNSERWRYLHTAIRIIHWTIFREEKSTFFVFYSTESISESSKNFFSKKVRHTCWLLGANFSVLSNEPVSTESIFREACLLCVSLVAFNELFWWVYVCGFLHSVEKRKISSHRKKFRQFNYSVISLVKPLPSRNLCVISTLCNLTKRSK